MASLDSELEDNESVESTQSVQSTPIIKTIQELAPGEPIHIPVLKDYQSQLHQSNNNLAQSEQKADITESNLFAGNKYNPLFKLGKFIVPLTLAGILALANQAKAQAGFEQFVYPHNGISPDSGWATLFKPDNTDSIVRKIGQFVPGYWFGTTPPRMECSRK